MPNRNWMHERAVQMPTIIQHWDGLAAITLSKLPDGSARLLWVFDEDHPQQLGLFVHLTADEAQIVYETPPEVGLLEVVRPTLAQTDALLWHLDQEVMSAKFVEIPRGGSEEDFWGYIGTRLEESFDRSVSVHNPTMTVASDDDALTALQAHHSTLTYV
jgi:hypothetical protein